MVESYFDAASIIDIHNHLRQGGLAYGELSPGHAVLFQLFLEWLRAMRTLKCKNEPLRGCHFGNLEVLDGTRPYLFPPRAKNA